MTVPAKLTCSDCGRLVSAWKTVRIGEITYVKVKFLLDRLCCSYHRVGDDETAKNA